MGARISATPAAKRSQPEPDINVTPLVDVCLVLLIIFMVIAPALEHGERVDLPGIFTPDKKKVTDPVTLTVAANGRVFFEKEMIEPAQLKERLAEIHARNPEKRVVLKGDQGLPYLKVREVFGLVQDTGFPGAALIVSQKGNAKDEDEGG